MHLWSLPYKYLTYICTIVFVIQYAVVRTKFDSMKKYNGGGAYISIYKPAVKNSQYSSARLNIQNGFDSIKVGWMVSQLWAWHIFVFLYCIKLNSSVELVYMVIDFNKFCKLLHKLFSFKKNYLILFNQLSNSY